MPKRYVEQAGSQTSLSVAQLTDFALNANLQELDTWLSNELNTKSKMESLTIQSADGQRLAIRLFRPDGASQRVIIIAPGIGIPQTFYTDFAAWLGTQGIAVVTFDFRGVGLSAPPNLKGFYASISDWAMRDLPAVIDVAKNHFPDVPMTYLGHSLGGQIFGLIPNHTVFDKVLTVASGSGYGKLLAPSARHKVPVLWHVLVPLSFFLKGYFAGKRWGVVGDLPRGVMAQWRRWCLHPEYLVGEDQKIRELYAQVTQPIKSLIVADDELMTPAGVYKLHQLYKGAEVQFETVLPQAYGLERVGHFGLFSKHNGAQLWPMVLRALS